MSSEGISQTATLYIEVVPAQYQLYLPAVLYLREMD